MQCGVKGGGQDSEIGETDSCRWARRFGSRLEKGGHGPTTGVKVGFSCELLR